MSECNCGCYYKTSFVEGQPGCVVCNPDISLASNKRYSANLVWSFAEIRSGVFALYNGALETVYIGNWNKMLELYRTRPAYVPPVRVHLPSKKLGLDLSKLEITL